jgi:hypothetical protein
MFFTAAVSAGDKDCRPRAHIDFAIDVTSLQRLRASFFSLRLLLE